MCGRFTRRYTWREVHDFLDVKPPSNWKAAGAASADAQRPLTHGTSDGETAIPSPAEAAALPSSFNVAPTQDSPVLRLDRDRHRVLTVARWGLVPYWAKDAKVGSGFINARSEAVATTPAFRSAFARHRCIVPVSGFYEWKRLAGGGKQPRYFHRADGRPMCFAAVRERWTGGAKPLESFAIITTAANAFVGRVHDRMPVVLEPEEFAGWLDPETPADVLAAMLDPAADGVLAGYPVSPRVNSVKNDDATLIEPVTEADESAGQLFPA